MNLAGLHTNCAELSSRSANPRAKQHRFADAAPSLLKPKRRMCACQLRQKEWHWFASEALLVRANTLPRRIIPAAFQKKAPFSSARAKSSWACEAASA
jgi:hypothetical protein